MAKRRNNGKKKTTATKPIRIAALIAAAIKTLRDTKGSSFSKIINYITLASELPQARVKRQVKAALNRGVRDGILKKYQHRYALATDDDLARADRIAIRFAKLRSRPNTPVASRDSVFVKKPVDDRAMFDSTSRSSWRLRHKLRRARSMPLSLASTATENGSCPCEHHSASRADEN